MAVSKRLRYEVLRRDNHQCRYCGAAAPDVKLTVDHVVPTALGGSDEPSNLVAACVDCNAGKSASSPDATVVDGAKEGALRWRACLRRAAMELAKEREGNKTHEDWFQKIWESWFVYDSSHYDSAAECPKDERRHYRLDNAWGWRRTLARWHGRLPNSEFLREAVDIAMGRNLGPGEATWRYFCGVVWRQISAIEERAVEHMVAVDPAPAEAPIDHGQFDYMVMVDAFLDQLVPALGGSDEVRKYVDKSFWGAMPEAHRAWAERVRDPGDLTDHETAQDVGTEAGIECMSSWIAHDMHEIRLWRESRDRGLESDTTGGTVGGS